MFLFSLHRLIILRGPEHHGKHDLARALADALPGPSVVIPYADLCGHWILHHGRASMEAELCYRLLKLHTTSFLKEGYNVVVDAPYLDEAAGTVSARHQDVLDLSRLARTFRGVQATVITLLGTGGPETEALQHSHIDGEIRVEGSGGDVDQFARDLLDRIASG